MTGVWLLSNTGQTTPGIIVDASHSCLGRCRDKDSDVAAPGHSVLPWLISFTAGPFKHTGKASMERYIFLPSTAQDHRQACACPEGSKIGYNIVAGEEPSSGPVPSPDSHAPHHALAPRRTCGRCNLIFKTLNLKRPDHRCALWRFCYFSLISLVFSFHAVKKSGLLCGPWWNAARTLQREGSRRSAETYHLWKIGSIDCF
ncbi:uncharacterized protein BDV17DRAFT_223383 [Aspergillus undulatus]|uniref:uncharacterized protein n=1 Tax=Aspergillus undulatus TaxID=1810928 RepID=UPI003CCE4F10